MSKGLTSRPSLSARRLVSSSPMAMPWPAIAAEKTRFMSEKKMPPSVSGFSTLDSASQRAQSSVSPRCSRLARSTSAGLEKPPTLLSSVGLQSGVN